MKNSLVTFLVVYGFSKLREGIEHLEFLLSGYLYLFVLNFAQSLGKKQLDISLSQEFFERKLAVHLLLHY